MKIIHTSDWHLGQNFFGYDRCADHDHMIEQLIGLVNDEKPDALLIAGDIYDVAVPIISAQKRFAEYLVRLHDARPEMVIVCISGNHDSASRHEIFQTPWEALNVHMVGKIDRENLESQVIPVGNKGWIVAVPYTNERFLDEDFYRDLESVVVTKAGNGMPVVYLGHAAVTGCSYTGHEIMNERFIGGIECTGIELIGTIYDYIALGHIHKAQTFDNGRARYCGSPLPVSFDEVRSGYEHGFSIVGLEGHGAPPHIRTQEVECRHPLVNIPSEGYCFWNDVMGELKNFPDDICAYLRLNVSLSDNEMLPYDKENQIARILEGKKGIYAAVNPVRETSVPVHDGSGKLTSLSVEELQKADPLTVMMSHAESEGFGFTEEFKMMFDEVIRIVNQSGHED